MAVGGVSQALDKARLALERDGGEIRVPQRYWPGLDIEER